jgi:hypothetical protein
MMCGISVLKCLVAVERCNDAESKCTVTPHRAPIKRGGRLVLEGGAVLSMANEQDPLDDLDD